MRLKASVSNRYSGLRAATSSDGEAAIGTVAHFAVAPNSKWLNCTALQNVASTTYPRLRTSPLFKLWYTTGQNVNADSATTRTFRPQSYKHQGKIYYWDYTANQIYEKATAAGAPTLVGSGPSTTTRDTFLFLGIHGGQFIFQTRNSSTGQYYIASSPYGSGLTTWTDWNISAQASVGSNQNIYDIIYTGTRWVISLNNSIQWAATLGGVTTASINVAPAQALRACRLHLLNGKLHCHGTTNYWFRSTDDATSFTVYANTMPGMANVGGGEYFGSFKSDHRNGMIVAADANSNLWWSPDPGVVPWTMFVLGYGINSINNYTNGYRFVDCFDPRAIIVLGYNAMSILYMDDMSTAYYGTTSVNAAPGVPHFLDGKLLWHWDGTCAKILQSPTDTITIPAMAAAIHGRTPYIKVL